jgi:RimJ/RimL family protein N-acetyltransferase
MIFRVLPARLALTNGRSLGRRQIYWIRTSRTREGAATEAIRLLADFGFATLGLVRVEIVVALGNFSSQRAAEKAGAYREGLLRNRITLWVTAPAVAGEAFDK